MSPTCRRHVGDTCICRQFLADIACQSDTERAPTSVLSVKNCRHHHTKPCLRRRRRGEPAQERLLMPAMLPLLLPMPPRRLPMPPCRLPMPPRRLLSSRTLGLMGKPPSGQQVFLDCLGLRHFEQPTLRLHPPCSRRRRNLLPLLPRCRPDHPDLSYHFSPQHRQFIEHRQFVERPIQQQHTSY